MSARDNGWVRIPADIDRQDTIVGRLTARQLLILSGAAVIMWTAFMTLHKVVPLWLLAAFAFPIAGAAAALAFGKRDGLGLDRFTIAALRHARAPKRLVTAPEGVPSVPDWITAPRTPLPAPLHLPPSAISDDGVITLGSDGALMLIGCQTVSFALRTPAEQDALIAGFARLLNSLAAPLQILIRAEQTDLSPAIATLCEAAPGLPHPALEQAALDHAAFLEDIAASRDLLTRQVLVAVREPATRAEPPDATATRVRRRAEETIRHLAALAVPAVILDGPAATAALATAVTPETR